MRDQGPYALCPRGAWGRGLPTVWGTRGDVDMMEHGPLPREPGTLACVALRVWKLLFLLFLAVTWLAGS